MIRVLLDTNAYGKLIKGNNPYLLKTLEESEKVYISPAVIGELEFGFRNGTKFKENDRILTDFLESYEIEIIPITRATANLYGEIKYNLKKAGTPIPVNDIWIASQTIETGSVLVTYDKHFIAIAGLRIWEH